MGKLLAVIVIAAVSVPLSLLAPADAGAQAGAVELFKVHEAPSEGAGITAGPDGNLWFTERDSRTIGRITPAGDFTEFPLRLDESEPPGQLTGGPDGNLWVATGGRSGTVLRVSPTGEQTGSFPAAPEGGDVEITAGPDGNLWFTELAGDLIGRLGIGGDPRRPPPAPMSKRRPTLRGRPAVGGSIAVSGGSWSGAPDELVYTWRRCDRHGGGCSVLRGDRDASLELTPEDLGHRLRAEVGAVNAAGKTFVGTEAGPPVRRGEPVATVTGGLLRIGRDGRVPVRIACFAGAHRGGCRGRLTLRNVARGGRVVGRVPYRVPGGRSGRPRVPLVASAVRRFASLPDRHLTVRVIATVRGGEPVNSLGSLVAGG